MKTLLTSFSFILYVAIGQDFYFPLHKLFHCGISFLLSIYHLKVDQYSSEQTPFTKTGLIVLVMFMPDNVLVFRKTNDMSIISIPQSKINLTTSANITLIQISYNIVLIAFFNSHTQGFEVSIPLVDLNLPLLGCLLALLKTSRFFRYEIR